MFERCTQVLSKKIISNKTKQKKSFRKRYRRNSASRADDINRLLFYVIRLIVDKKKKKKMCETRLRRTVSVAVLRNHYFVDRCERPRARAITDY